MHQDHEDSPGQSKKTGKSKLFTTFATHPKQLRIASIVGVAALVIALLSAFAMSPSGASLEESQTFGGITVSLPAGMSQEKQEDGFGVSSCTFSGSYVRVTMARREASKEDAGATLASLLASEMDFSSITGKMEGDDAVYTAVSSTSSGDFPVWARGRIVDGWLYALVVTPTASGRTNEATARAIFDSYSFSSSDIKVTLVSDGETYDTLSAEAPAGSGAIVKLPHNLTKDRAVFDAWKLSGDSDARVVEEKGSQYLTGATEDTKLEAQWSNAWVVTFTDGNGNTIGETLVRNGEAASAPSVKDTDTDAFAGWDADFSNVTQDMTVNATWNHLWTVTFTDGNGTTLDTQTVENGEAAKAPSKEPTKDGYEFTGWDADFSAVTSDLTVNATWERLPTTAEKNAVSRAKSYLDYTAFSYSGLIDQLEFEGYTTEEATYGVDHCGADWYEQAALMAEDYLEYTSFSRSGLIDQLEFEGFTYDQAVYGVNAVGL
ncbi:MAG: Ltp family lipoprotein [Tractidigestivibacter sp.]|jgi:hypothetical protein|uniref:Ltp family lipoprotein n=1 Tax=Tractidigestivibacter sp. TaxID=2847320 RepID=UPI003D8CA057